MPIGVHDPDKTASKSLLCVPINERILCKSSIAVYTKRMRGLLIDKAASLIAPHVCLSCGDEGSILCDQCIALYFEPIHSHCAGCKQLSSDFRVCSSCRTWLHITNIYVATSYDGIGEQLIRAMKFSQKRQAVKPTAQMMFQVFSEVESEALLCPIPTAPARIRERGFDHTELLGRELGAHLEAGVIHALRRHSNVRQLGSSRQARIKQAESEFEIKDVRLVAGKHIVLVDDVMTTGATLSAAAKVLKDAGAKSVSAIIFAQKM